MPPTFLRMKKSILCLILLLAACGPRTEETQQAPPAAAVAPIAGVALDTALALLHSELSAAYENDLDDAGIARFQRAEALTDRLLETRYPTWLRSESYSVDAKLRQIQALADRVVAQIGSNAPKDSALTDLKLLMSSVTALREALKAGGGAPPPPPWPSRSAAGGARGCVCLPASGTPWPPLCPGPRPRSRTEAADLIPAPVLFAGMAVPLVGALLRIVEVTTGAFSL